MTLRRNIDQYLLNWKVDDNRKALLLRGARQVGKTFSVREFGKSFKYFIEVNFESDDVVRSIFEGNLNPKEICNKLSTYFNIPINNGETLLFLDEIQACIPAISSLRFFFEKLPGLHVIAAGSLLEFALSELPSFGVGRVESVFMYPLSFDEFLLANHEDSLYDLKQNASHTSPIDNIFHTKLTAYLRQFMLTGGLPEVVRVYTETGDLFKTQKILDNLIIGLNDDFSKYKKRVPVSRIRDIFEAVANQSGSKFLFSKIGGNHNYEQLKEARNLLEMAGLIHTVYHTSANGLPLGASTNYKRFKVLLYDHGVYHRTMGLELSKKLLLDSFNPTNKGSIAEQFTGLELIKYTNQHSRKNIYYWHREKRGSNAEVDFIIQKEEKIVPIEVKSGTTGKMQSLRILMNEKGINPGVRVSMENFCKYDNILVYPLYAINNLVLEDLSIKDESPAPNLDKPQ
ncbi:MAG: ATP-binding protein [Bacteroidetes bacterium]|nr:MAG: ATP-binding protein [Bacteroidota bacterium]